MADEDFKREIIGDIVIEKVKLSRATVKEAQSFKDRLFSDSISGFNKIIVDLSDCTFVDSSMIGAMVVMLKRMSQKGGELRVVIPETEAFQVFTVTGLFRAFNIYRSVEEALKDF
ncbi:MAG TPA: STAS domain-containing protein [Ignavibacteriaceae bacterium]|nr:STAS domain-containing protein [Ignavibacteriaceae bacterium]